MFKAYRNYKLSGGLWNQPEGLDSKLGSCVTMGGSLDSSWPPLSNGGHNNVFLYRLWVQWDHINNKLQQWLVTHGSRKCYLLLSYAQCFWVSNIVGPDALFNSGNLCDALFLLPCPPPPPHANIHLSSQKMFQGGLNFELPKWRNEEAKVSLSPLGMHLTKIWSGSEASQRTAENHIVRLKCIKAMRWHEPPWGASPFSHIPGRIALGPGRMGSHLPSHMAPSLL